MKPSPTTRPTSPTQELLTANQIASELGRSPSSILEKIRTLGISPAGSTGSWKLYPPAVLEQLRGAMRAPNRKTVSTPTGI
jgi:hypothetical protein